MDFPGVSFGPGVEIPQPQLVNLYGCSLGAEVMVAAFVEIGPGVTVGPKTRIQAHAFIPKGVTIGANCFIGPRVTFCNDKYPPSGVITGITVEDDVVIGAGATILPGVTISKGAKIGAGAVVTRDVPLGATWVGNPAQELRRSDGYRTAV